MNRPGFAITASKGFHVTFANGWTVSVQFGPGNYCDNYGRGIGREDAACGKEGSSVAEVAVWRPDGNMVDLGGDTVRGWQTPAAILALMNAAANGDLTNGKIPPAEHGRSPVGAGRDAT